MSNQLSPRELDVLQLMSNGTPTNKIAKFLGITYNTVKKYKQHINEKLDTRNSAHSVAEGIRRGLI